MYENIKHMDNSPSHTLMRKVSESMQEYIIDNSLIYVERIFSEEGQPIEEVLVDYFKEKTNN